MLGRLRCLASVLGLVVVACGSDKTLYIGVHETDGALESDSPATTATSGGADAGAEPSGCEAPTAPPADLSEEGFYTKYVSTNGIPILAPDSVDDEALVEACGIVGVMLEARSDVAEQMVKNEARVAIMDEDQALTDLPGFEDLSPGWDDERGAGATQDLVWTAAAEENLLCLPSDVYEGEIILVHSFAHSMRSLGIVPLEDDFDARLEALYEAALADGRWEDTYAATNFAQYWAEGVQTWFDANQERDPPDGIHNSVNTRAELREYDPGLFDLIAEYYSDTRLSLSCF